MKTGFCCCGTPDDQLLTLTSSRALSATVSAGSGVTWTSLFTVPWSAAASEATCAAEGPSAARADDPNTTEPSAVSAPVAGSSIYCACKVPALVAFNHLIDAELARPGSCSTDPSWPTPQLRSTWNVPSIRLTEPFGWTDSALPEVPRLYWKLPSA